MHRLYTFPMSSDFIYCQIYTSFSVWPRDHYKTYQWFYLACNLPTEVSPVVQDDIFELMFLGSKSRNISELKFLGPKPRIISELTFLSQPRNINYVHRSADEHKKFFLPILSASQAGGPQKPGI
jgi:hypothetical protein